MLLAKAALLQLLQQPGHLIPGVPLAPGAEAVITRHQQGKLLQLLGKTALCFGGSPLQVLRRDAAALELVDTIDQSAEKLRLRFHGSICLQAAAELAGCCRHGHDAAAIIQTLHSRVAHGICHPAAKAGKGKHLRIPAGGIAGPAAEPAFHIMADKFRNQQDPAGLFFMDISGNAAQNLVPVGSPVPAQQKMEHGFTLFLFFLHDTTESVRRTGDKSAGEEDIFQLSQQIQHIKADHNLPCSF